MRAKIKFIGFISFLLISFIFLTGCPQKAPEENSTGDIPEFSFEKIGGGTMTNEDLMGKIVFIDFWATWCGPCRGATPYVNKLYEEFKNEEEVLVIGMNLDYNKNIDEINTFVKKEKIQYVVLKADQKITNQFKIRGIPAFFVLNKEGKIAKKYVGFDPSFFKQMSDDIKKLLQE